MSRSRIVDAASGAWLRQFGTLNFPVANTIEVLSGSAVNGANDLFHAEARHDRVLGADFAYSATITANWTRPDLSVDLQFRISDEGRYGVRLQHGTIALYQFMLPDRPCGHDPAVIAHCPLWPMTDPHHRERDDAPVEKQLEPHDSFDPALQTLRVTVVAEGSTFIVSFGTPSQDLEILKIEDIEHGIGIGRFGIYVRAAKQRFDVTFSDVVATTDPTATSNFALLYSTPGYDLDGTKRALVRTVNDIAAQDYDDANSTFRVTNASGEVKIRDRRFEESGYSGRGLLRRVSSPFRRTLGFQFLAADFTDLREAGRYTLEARLATSGGIRVLRSAPFEIIPRLVTERMLWPLSILNAQARRAAEEDFRRNWFVESGQAAWSVGLDGAFIADRADDQQGAVLRRIFDCGNVPLLAKDLRDFRFTASITIVAGCDAQLQFRITDDERWAVTLQAGAAGGCEHGDGPGALRLHREGPAVLNDGQFEEFASHRMDSNPFQVGRAYDVEVRASSRQIEVMLDGVRVINQHLPEASIWNLLGRGDPRSGVFALKAWGSTVRFEHVKVWARDVGLSRPAPGVWIPYDRATRRSSQGFRITTPDFENNGVSPTNKDEIKNPLAAQQHGFQDCNSFIGEVTSHSVFLSSLLDVWSTRAHTATPSQQEDLRRAILTALLYLEQLHEQGNRSGAWAHQEPGRAALAISDKALTTRFAMYGLSAFAEKGDAVDKKLARIAFDRASAAWRWLDEMVGPPTTSWVVGDVEHVASGSPQGDLAVFSFSPGPGWQVVNVSEEVGQKIVGAPAASWMVGDVEHVAAGSPQGELLVFFFSPGADWKVVNVSQEVGQKIVGPPSTSWVVGDVEHVAASSAQGDLLVFFFSPGANWKVVNVSEEVGQKIVGPPSTSWVVDDVEHVAASSAQGDLLVFFFSPGAGWKFVNVSQEVGQKIVGPPSTSWVVGDVEHVAASSPQGDLVVFFFSPGADWKFVNVSQEVGQKIVGPPSTSWVVGNVEHVAAASPQGELLVFFFSPGAEWKFVNVSEEVGQKIVGPPTASWAVGNVEHVAARSPQGELLVFFFSPGADWQVVNVCGKVGQYLGRDIVLDSIVAIRMARSALREGLPAAVWLDRARTNALGVLDVFEKADYMANEGRPTLRSIPWFEGVYEAFFRGPLELSSEQSEKVQNQAKNIAGQLVALMKNTANGFCLIPQAHGPGTAHRNWNNLVDLPLAVCPIPDPKDALAVGDWYISNHFATAAADCVYIGRLAGQRTLERLATGNLYWILGLNPGIPTTKVVPPAPTDGPWSAASFVYNGLGAFARSFEGNRTRTNAAKGWLADWEESASSRHRESWAIDLARNGFQSIVNGHVLRENQWHYWSIGTAGWVCAETFMLTDAGFLKAAVALEDWHSGSTLVKDSPYDVTKLHFFDTTHVDRANTLWLFDDPDRTPAALASRMATDFAASKGFGAGRLTGHHIGERVGVLCLPVPGTAFEDVASSEIAALRFKFDDINTDPWAKVARAATEIAARRGAGAGFFTGHHGLTEFGWIGIDARLVEVFDIDDRTVADSPWAFTDINTVGWAQAARLATDICIQSGFAGGFFTGHQLPNKRQIAALRYT